MAPLELPVTKHVVLEIPEPHVLLVTINLAKQMNSLPIDACWEMDSVWRFLDDESQLRVGILTGAGKRAFSAGMDLKERTTLQTTTAPPRSFRRHHSYPSSGFGGMTRRVGLKPIIAAVNGFAFGGGFELALNADIILASTNASFRLPDVLRGTSALQGALPRLVRTLGMQRASLVALSGYEVNAKEAAEWGLVAKIVEPENLRDEAVKLGSMIASMSPDSVIVSRAGLREAWDEGSVERAAQKTEQRWGEWLMGGENVREGMMAFAEKRIPRWKASRL